MENTTTILIKSGTKQKSLNSYIIKIVKAIQSYKIIELKAYGKNLLNLHRITILIN